MIDLKGHLVVLLFRLIALLPWKLVQKIGGFLGYLTYLLPTKTKQVAFTQLKECFPNFSKDELTNLLRESLINAGKTTAECICIWVWEPEHSLKFIKQVDGQQQLKEAINSDKSVICLAMHLGNWELIGHYLGGITETLCFYRPFKLPVVDNFIQRKRSKTKTKVVPSNKKGILAVMKRVKNGGLVGIPIDNEPTKETGIFVPFLGSKALTSKFVYSLLAKNDALVFFVHAIRCDDGFFKILLEPASANLFSSNVVESVTALSKSLEGYVKKYPEQYLWGMKKFKNRPPNYPKLY